MNFDEVGDTWKAITKTIFVKETSCRRRRNQH